MSTNQESLILSEQEAAASAPSLFPDLEGASLEGADRSGEYSGERLYKQRPQTYRLIVEALGAGLGIKAIARTLHVSRNTVRAVRDRERPAVDPLLKRTTHNLRRFSDLAAERLIEEIDDIPLSALPIAMGIATEKAQLLEGQATSRVERRAAEPSIDDVRSYLQGLPSAGGEMGLPGEEDRQRDRAASAVDGELVGPADTGCIDCESIVSKHSTADDTVSDTGVQP